MHNIARRTLILAGIVASLCTAGAGQAIAFVLPEKAADTAFVDMIIERLRKHVTVAIAYRDGKPLPMRVLLRYNFKKLDGIK